MTGSHFTQIIQLLCFWQISHGSWLAGLPSSAKGLHLDNLDASCFPVTSSYLKQVFGGH